MQGVNKSLNVVNEDFNPLRSGNQYENVHIYSHIFMTYLQLPVTRKHFPNLNNASNMCNIY